MQCPACQEELVVVERQEVELDYCAECGGLWFDAGELELLAKKSGVEALPPLENPKAPPLEKPRRCPRCRKKMKKKVSCGASQVLLDLCPQGEGIWFDRGELELLFQQLESKEGHPAFHFLGETLQGRKSSP